MTTTPFPVSLASYDQGYGDMLAALIGHHSHPAVGSEGGDGHVRSVRSAFR